MTLVGPPHHHPRPRRRRNHYAQEEKCSQTSDDAMSTSELCVCANESSTAQVLVEVILVALPCSVYKVF